MTDPPAHRYDARLAGAIEERWQLRWKENATFAVDNPTEGPAGAPSEPIANRFFLLDMFPYPSGSGLHVGHPLGYIGTDVFGRFKRMTGFHVLHALGYDAFGLPAEQYAVQTGQHPRVTTSENIATMRRQLRRLGLAHDPRRGISTADPSFYRWTQWIFLQILDSWYDESAHRARPISELEDEFAAGRRSLPDARVWGDLDDGARSDVIDSHRLAYLRDAPVNWCPGLGTVLANEEVTSEGRSDIGNFPVFRRTMRQWTLRITAYADRLLHDLDLLDWPEPIKIMQRNWIGRSEGAEITFAAQGENITVFTTRPDTIFGATYVVLAPEHPLADAIVAAAWPDATPESWRGGAATPKLALEEYRAAAAAKTDRERQQDTATKSGVHVGTMAVHPLTGDPIPIFVADYVLMGYGTGAVMGVPGQDQRDWDFAAAFGLDSVRTVQPPDGWEGEAYTGAGGLINSPGFDGLSIAEAKSAIVSALSERGRGRSAVTYRLRDWLFARQRYWGEPIPVVFDDAGRPRAIPEDQLPVLLPDLDDFRPDALDPDDGESDPRPPLSRAEAWLRVELDLGDGPRTYKRELSVMPQWAGSCWYEIRYLDPDNAERFVDPLVEAYWMGPRSPGGSGGVDLYMGGVEHAVLHLLYARFWHKVLFDLGQVSSSEPFHRLFNQGYIQAHAYRDPRGQVVPAAEVEEVDGRCFHHGVEVEREFGKMGKSLKNSVTPDELYRQYGADTLRLYEMSMGPLDMSRPWETRAVVGMFRFLQRVWRLVIDEASGDVRVSEASAPDDLARQANATIVRVRRDMERLHFNTAISALMKLTRSYVRAVDEAMLPRELAEELVLMLAPFAPHVSEELWSRLGHGTSLAYEPFPVADERYLELAETTYSVQINGKTRSTVAVPVDAEESEVVAVALADAKVASSIGSRPIRKQIFVPGRTVSFVV